jgi:hypothetical protein
MITIPPDTDEQAGIEIDPRIHQRRVEVQRENTRRRLRVLAAAGGVVVLAVLTLVGLHSPLASVRHRVVLGARHDADATVLAAGGLTPGRPLIDVSASAATRRIETLPWVERATVTKQWPSGVRVAVVERRAVAQLPIGASTSGPVDLVDVTGRVLAYRSGPVPDLPLIMGAGRIPTAGKWLAGAPGQKAADDAATVAAGIDHPRSTLAAALALASTFTTAGLGQSGAGVGSQHLYIGRIELSGGSLSALVEPDLSTVQLGGATELEAKVDATLAMLTNADIPAGSTVAVTTPQSPTVTPPAAAQSG